MTNANSLLDSLRQKPVDLTTPVTGMISANGKMIIVGEPEHAGVGFVSVHRRQTINSPWERLLYHYGKEANSQLGKEVGIDGTGATMAFYVPLNNMVYVHRVTHVKPIVQPFKTDPVYEIPTIGYKIVSIKFSSNGDVLGLISDKGIYFEYIFDEDGSGYEVSKTMMQA